MSRADFALLVAGVSLGVALATFIWRIIFDIYLDAPHVKLTLQAMTITGFGQKPADLYVVTATNTGRRPTTITSLWLNFGRPRRRRWRLLSRIMLRRWRENLFARGLMIPDQAWTAYNTNLPTRLDVGEQANAYYSRDAVHKNLKTQPYGFMFGGAGVTTGTAPDSRPIRVTSEMRK